MAGRLEVAVVRTVLLLAIHRNLGRVHVQHVPLGGIQNFCLADEFPVTAGQPGEVLLLSQYLGFKRLQAATQGRPTFPDLLGADQPERRILREPLGIVDIFIDCDVAVDGLTEEIGERKLGVLPLS